MDSGNILVDTLTVKAGRVGIGTTSPGSALEINAAASTSPFIAKINNAESARINSSGNVMMGSTTPLTPDARLSVIANADFGAGLAIGSTASATNWARLDFKNTNAASPAILYQDQTGLFAIRTDGAYPITFNTNGANEHARITSGGQVLLGATSPTEATRLFSTSTTSTTGPALVLQNTDGGSTSYNIAVFYRESTLVGRISTTNTATAYNTSSDYRLKENVVPLTGAVDRLQQIPVHRFNFIADPDNTVDGFLAHEAQAVVPECVTGTKDEVDAEGNPVYQGIDQSKLVPLLTAALQEAIGEIASLKNRVAAL
jgi:hypothetical protein